MQRKFGEATGNKNQQVKGAGKQIEGKVQKYVGDVKEVSKDDDKDY